MECRFYPQEQTLSARSIATDRVAKAAADGYMLLMGGNSSLVMPFETRSRTSRRSLKYSSFRTCSPFRQSCRSRLWRNWWHSPERSPVSFPVACRRRHVAASGRRIVQIHGACRYCTGALSRHDGVNARPARQSNLYVVRQYRECGAARAGREIARAGHHLDQALGPGARPADHGGIRIRGSPADIFVVRSATRWPRLEANRWCHGRQAHQLGVSLETRG